VGGEATVENVVCETKLLGFEGLVRSEALGALNWGYKCVYLIKLSMRRYTTTYSYSSS
jgi:hypothetical protein